MAGCFANLRLRILAFLLDYIIIAAYLLVLTAVGVWLGFGPLKETFRTLFADPNASDLSAFLLLILPVILYFALFEHSSWQATWGKRRMHLYVTDAHGAKLSLGRSLGRSAIKFLPWELAHACIFRIPGWPLAPRTPPPLIMVGLVLVWVLVGAYLFSLLTSKKCQTLYDRLAGTIVIKEGRPTFLLQS